MTNTSKIKNPALIVMNRELKSFFTGIMAYIVIAVFLFITGFFFFSVFFFNNVAELRGLFSLLPTILSFLIPALTMRLFAEETRSGSLETLMTLPVTEFQVVLGKFLASLISTLIMIAPTLLYIIAIQIFGTPDYGPVIGGFLGIIFLCAAFTAIGCFASAVTKNQIIAWITGALICFALTMLDSISFLLPTVFVNAFNYLGIGTHFDSIAKGILDTRDVIYFISLTAVFFVGTIYIQKKDLKWKKGLKSEFVLFCLLIVLSNCVSSKAFKKIDLTAEKTYSLSPASKSVVRNLREPLTVRVFMDKDQTSQFAQVSQYVKDILQEYKSCGNDNFHVYFMDMKKEENIQMANEYGIYQSNDQNFSNNEVSVKMIFRGISISYADSIEIINPINESAGFEYALTQKMSKMVSGADILSNLSENDKLKVTLFITDSLKTYDSNTYVQIKDFVQQSFNSVNNKLMNRLEFETVNLSEEEFIQKKDKYGLTSIRIQDQNKNIFNLCVGMIVSKDEEFRVLPIGFVQNGLGILQGLENCEEYISQGIQSLFYSSQKIGYMTGHGEHNIDDKNDSAVFANILSDSYELEQLNLKENDIPFGMNTIVINGPVENYTEEELYKLDQFVMRGGNLAFFIDSGMQNQMARYTGGPAFNPLNLNIERLLESYGIKHNIDFVFDSDCASNKQGHELYYIPIINRSQMAKKNPITQNLNNVILFLNSSLDVSKAEENPDAKVSVLVKTSDKSWVTPVEESDVVYELVPEESKLSSKIASVVVDGKFKSAFQNAPESMSQDDFISSSRLPGKIFVFTSSHVTVSDVISGSGREPIEILVRNAFDYLNGNEDLCLMRSKGTSVNRLTLKSPVLALVLQIFYIAGLPVITAACCVIVMILRKKRRIQIREKYNPDDERSIK